MLLLNLERRSSNQCLKPPCSQRQALRRKLPHKGVQRSEGGLAGIKLGMTRLLKPQGAMQALLASRVICSASWRLPHRQQQQAVQRLTL